MFLQYRPCQLSSSLYLPHHKVGVSASKPIPPASVFWHRSSSVRCRCIPDWGTLIPVPDWYTYSGTDWGTLIPVPDWIRHGNFINPVVGALDAGQACIPAFLKIVQEVAQVGCRVARRHRVRVAQEGVPCSVTQYGTYSVAQYGTA